MRNLIVFFSIVLTGWSWGQGFEDFNLSNATASYLDGSFVGNNGITWNYVHSRDEGVYPIDGKGLMLRRSDEPSSLSASLTGGIASFSVDTRKAFTGNAQRRLELLINNVVVAQFEPEFGSGADATIIPFEVNDINIEGTFDLVLRLYGTTGNQQITLDNLVWTGYTPGVPSLTVLPSTLLNLNYDVNYGPSASTSFQVSGLNLDPANGSVVVDVTGTEFEVSTDDENFSASVSLAYTAGELENTAVYARLKAGLSAGLYTDVISVSGGDADAVEVSVEGRVFDPIELPYTNPFRTTTDFTTAQEQGFDLSTVLSVLSAGGYIRIPLNGYIETPIIDFTQYDGIEVAVDLTTLNGIDGQVLSFQISNDGGTTYSTIESIELTTAGTVYNTYNVIFDVTDANSVVNGKLRFAMTAGIAQIRFRDLSITEFTGKIWGGTTDSAWTTALNWIPSGVPETDDTIQIPSGTDFSPIVSGNLAVAATGSIVLKSGAHLTINGAIENNGTVTIESGATLVQTGTSTNAGSGAFHVAQALDGAGGATPNGRGYYIGTPVSGATSVTFNAAGSNGMWVYSEAANGYSEITDNSTALDLMEGYVVRLGTTDTYTFTGSGLNNGALSATNLTRTGTTNPKRGYHLVSNPYPSYLNWDDVDAANLSSTMWYRTEGASGMVFDTYNSNGGVAVSNSGTPVTNFIPPMQAFWVYVENDGETGALTFNNSMRSHQPGAFGLKAGDDHAAFVRINLLDALSIDQTVVYFTEQASDGFDPYDSKKQFLSNRPQIFTQIGDEELVIQGLHDMATTSQVAVSIQLPASGEFTLQAEEVEMEDGVVVLEDKMTETFLELTHGVNYTFNADEGADHDRFVLHFNVNPSTASVSAVSLDEIHIQADLQGNVNIHLPVSVGENGSVRITDLSGRVVHSSGITSGTHAIQLSETSGIYVIQVNSNAVQRTQKIIIVN